MISLLALLAALAAPAVPAATAAPAPAAAQTPAALAEPVKEPEWLSIPSQSLMANCTTGYLTDPTFTGESIVMGCIVQKDGSIDQCRVKETKRAQAAHVEDVAVCASAGFKIGPLDKFGKPTAGRPMLIPMAIVTGTPEPAGAQAAGSPATAAPAPATPTTAQPKP